MIHNITSGKGFAGVLAYVRGKDHRIIDAEGVDIEADVAGMARDLAGQNDLNPRVKKPVFHASLALPAGEDLTDEQWSDVVREYVARMGYDRGPWVAALHLDTDHPHIHVVASRIRDDGRRVPSRYKTARGWLSEAERGQEILRDLERRYGLRQVPSSHEVDRGQPSRGEFGLMRETEALTIRQDLRNRIAATVATKPRTLPEYIRALERVGVFVDANVQSTGRLAGLTYIVHDENGRAVRVKASDLGKKYTARGLEHRGITYDATRDAADVQEASARARAMDRDLRADLADVERQADNAQDLAQLAAAHDAAAAIAERGIPLDRARDHLTTARAQDAAGTARRLGIGDPRASGRRAARAVVVTIDSRTGRTIRGQAEHLCRSLLERGARLIEAQTMPGDARRWLAILRASPTQAARMVASMALDDAIRQALPTEAQKLYQTLTYARAALTSPTAAALRIGRDVGRELRRSAHERTL